MEGNSHPMGCIAPSRPLNDESDGDARCLNTYLLPSLHLLLGWKAHIIVGVDSQTQRNKTNIGTPHRSTDNDFHRSISYCSYCFSVLEEVILNHWAKHIDTSNICVTYNLVCLKKSLGCRISYLSPPLMQCNRVCQISQLLWTVSKGHSCLYKVPEIFFHRVPPPLTWLFLPSPSLFLSFTLSPWH